MVRHYRFVPAIALAVVFATAAPALAQPNVSSSPSASSTPATSCSGACSTGYIRAEKTVSTAGANGPLVASSTASRGSDVLSGHGYVNPTAPATIVRTVAPSDGFDWGDAGIGAGAALVLLLVIGAGVFGVTNSRRHAASSAA